SSPATAREIGTLGDPAMELGTAFPAALPGPLPPELGLRCTSPQNQIRDSIGRRPTHGGRRSGWLAHLSRMAAILQHRRVGRSEAEQRRQYDERHATTSG